MARKNPEREALLQQVLSRQRAAGKKVSRLKSQGIELAGTKNDPRRPANNVKRYNTRQLRAHLERLNTFTSRKTRFAADAHGKLLSPTDWQRYKRAENQINRAKKKVLDKIGDIKAPGAGGLTIAERLKVMTPNRPRAGNPAANPFTFVQRKSTAFTSSDALKKLTDDLQRKLKSDFLASDLKASHAEARDMLSTLGADRIQSRLDKMSDFHFNILWNFTSFATDVSYPYELYKKILAGEGEKWHEEKLSENLKNAEELINAVEKIKFRR